MLNTMLTPMLEGYWAEIASALAIILIGVWAETCGVTKKSVGVNALGVFLMLVTAGIDLAVLPLLILYLMLGVTTYRERWKRAYFFFSSKTYGCLMLAIAMLHTPKIQVYLDAAIQPAAGNYTSLGNLVAASTAVVVAFWFVGIPFAYLAGWVYKKLR